MLRLNQHSCLLYTHHFLTFYKNAAMLKNSIFLPNKINNTIQLKYNMISIKAIKSYSLIVDVKIQACETRIPSCPHIVSGEGIWCLITPPRIRHPTQKQREKGIACVSAGHKFLTALRRKMQHLPPRQSKSKCNRSKEVLNIFITKFQLHKVNF